MNGLPYTDKLDLYITAECLFESPAFLATLLNVTSLMQVVCFLQFALVVWKEKDSCTSHASKSMSHYGFTRETKKANTIPGAIWSGVISFLGIWNKHVWLTDIFPLKTDIHLWRISQERQGWPRKARNTFNMVSILVANMMSFLSVPIPAWLEYVRTTESEC